MKNNKIILFALIALSSIAYSAKNEIPVSAQLKESQLALIKQSFLSVKPETDSFLSSFKSVQNFIKQEKKDSVLVSARNLFQDRVSYITALAAHAEAEKYPAFAALLYDISQKKAFFCDPLEGALFFGLGFCSCIVSMGVLNINPYRGKK